MSDILKNEILEKKASQMKGMILFHSNLSFEVEENEETSKFENYLTKRIQFKADAEATE